MKSLYTLKKNLSENGIFLCFSGPFSQELLVEIGEVLKQKMRSADESTATILKVFSIMVEQSQNIILHSDEKLEGEDVSSQRYMSGMIVVGKSNDKYFVATGNKIRSSKVKMLSENLTKLQHMDKDELKKYYKEKRKSGRAEENKGAGLGLIELARKASKPIEFCFKDIDRNYSYFSIKTVV